MTDLRSNFSHCQTKLETLPCLQHQSFIVKQNERGLSQPYQPDLITQKTEVEPKLTQGFLSSINNLDI